MSWSGSYQTSVLSNVTTNCQLFLEARNQCLNKPAAAEVKAWFCYSTAKPRISTFHLLNLERGKPKAAAEKHGLAHPAQNLNTKTLHVRQPRLCKIIAVDIGLFLALPHSQWCFLQALPASFSSPATLCSLHPLTTAPYTHSQKSLWMLSGELSQLWPPDQTHSLPHHCLKAVTVVRCLLI